MNATEVIEAYVTDVAVLLPRKQRNDVAFELRELLNEGLQGKADGEGRAADAAMATEFVRGFGQPAEVAARYRPTLTIIDPADGHTFVRASAIGLLLIWCAGLARLAQQPAVSGGDFLLKLGQWWGDTLIPSFWWPGVLVAGFGIAARVRRRSPQARQWKPRASDRIPGGRAAMTLALLGILCGLSVLIDPRWLLDVAFSGRAAPAAYDALTYTRAFRQQQGLCLLVLLTLNIPVLIMVIASGRWSALMRRIDFGLRVATCAALVWAVAGGPIFMARSSDQMIKLIMAGILAVTLIDLGIKFHRSVRPTPQATRA